MFNCPSCGAPMQDGQRFCAKCGAQASNPTPTAPITPVTPNYGASGSYGAPGYGAYGAPGGIPSRGPGAPVSFQQKNIVVCVILYFVTCMIYPIIWMIDLVNNVNEASGDTTGNSGGTVFLLGLVTCGIYWLIWVYKAGEKLNTAKASRGLPVDSNSGVTYLLLSLFGLTVVALALIQSDLNKIAALYGAPPA